MPEQFIMSIRPIREGFSPETVTEAEAAKVGAHWEYIKGAFDAGTVTFVGRTTEWPFIGYCVFMADSRDAAERFMAGDPAVSGGVFHATLQTFVSLLLNPNGIGN